MGAPSWAKVPLCRARVSFTKVSREITKDQGESDLRTSVDSLTARNKTRKDREPGEQRGRNEGGMQGMEIKLPQIL